MNRARPGFTLIEIMVSIMIFSIVGLAMLAIMLTASDIYRRGEAGRSANDEAVAVMAALDEDLGRIVPATDGGWFYADIDGAGDTLVAFKVVRRDRSQLRGASTTPTTAGTGGRAIVAWWVDGGGDLYRGEIVAPHLDDDPMTDQDVDTLRLLRATPAAYGVMTSGCLHFGAYLAAHATGRRLHDEWLVDGNGDETLPNQTTLSVNTTTWPDDFPAAIRITTVLTGGGRFATEGFLLDRLDASLGTGTTSFRIAGAKGVPATPGSMLRIGDEWIGYDSWDGQRIVFTTPSTDPLVGRARRRSALASHAPRDPVRFGKTYTLVRALPR